MIRIDSISKQNGHQLVFVEASAALNCGEKIGLVGPNGAGKTTLFRLITGREEADEGVVSTDKGITIGYFSQDVGEMAGRSAVDEGSIVVGKLLEKSGNYGFNAQTEEYVDMVAAGIIDPTKVVRVALQDAASVASLLITTEAMIAEKPKNAAPQMPGGGGGMGGMGGGMDF